jgi:hypothetical protein
MGLLSFYVAGCKQDLTPGEAKQQEIPFQVLQDEQVKTLESYGEVLLPGSTQAGLAHFIDHQLNATSQDQMLMIKYLGVQPPYSGFYLAGLAALNNTAMTMHSLPFFELSEEQKTELAIMVSRSQPDGWSGPPAPFFSFVLRSDAVDVVYGTQQGIESLGIPHMMHIQPPSRWGE